MAIKYLDAKRIRGELGSAGSAELDGSNDYIDLGGSATTYNFLTAGSFSISCWIKITPAHDKILFDNMNDRTPASSVGLTYIIEGAGGGGYQITVKFSDGSSNQSFATSAVWDTTDWQHFCSTYDGTTMKVYRNGTQVASQSITSNSNDQSFVPRIGWGANGEKGKLAGNIDDFLITNDILSSTEISALSGGTAVSAVSPAISNQQVHYKFSENFNDSSGNSRNATATGSEISSSVYKHSKPDDKATLVTAASSGTAITQSTASAHSAIRTGDKEEFGMRCAAGSALNGITPNNITLTLKKEGSPTGNCYVKIYREASGSTETAVYTSPALDVSTITTSDADYTFDLGGATEIDDDYKIIFNYVGGSSGNVVRIAYDPNNSYDGNNTGLTIRNTAGSGNFDTAHNNGYEMKFVLRYGVTSASSDLPENTIFEETDTRKYYFLQSSVWERAYVKPTFEDDFSGSDNWADNSSSTIVVNTSNDEIDWDIGSGSGTSNSATYYDLGSSSKANDTKWTLTFKLIIDNYTSNSGSSCHMGIGLSEKGQGHTYQNSQDSIMFVMATGNNDTKYYNHHSDAQETLDVGANRDFLTRTPSAETIYVKLVRESADTITSYSYSDKIDGTLLEKKTTTMGGNPQNLRYIAVMGRMQNTNTCNGNIDDIKFYDGVIL